jgi:pimeloyl-ACP methyl ester carboxylesterase
MLRTCAAVLTLFAATALAQTPAPSMDGAWAGALDISGIQLHLVFHIASSAAGLTSTMDSPDQGAKGIPTTSTTLTGNKLTIAVAMIHGEFVGTASPDGKSIAGMWEQGGNSLPLTLKPLTGAASLEPKRPQTPKPPFPYASEDVTYPNPQGHNTLAATLTLPEGKGPFPAVLLITGSGPNDRDETILGHKPFLVLADYLTRHGIAVLRADKRGVGKSTGDLATATSADFATDAQAGLDYLHTRTEIDPRRTGLLGHSEGGLIAPVVAAAHPAEVAFIVLLAGPGEPGLDIIVAQTRLISLASGVAPAVAEKNAAEERTLLTTVTQSKDDASLQQQLTVALGADGMPKDRVPGTIQQLTSPWFRYFLSYDPAPTLARARCPVLALDGSKDVQVPPAENLALIRKALESGDNKHVTTEELPGLNHLFQHATTGAPNEYAKIEETISPEVLTKVSTWILAQPSLTVPKK